MDEDMTSNKIKSKKKHIDICIKVEKIVKKKALHKYHVYKNTHTTNNTYQKLEEASGEEFWSIRLYPDIISKGYAIKDPDLVVTYGNIVKNVIEVKWGAIKGSKITDMKDIFKMNSELEKWIDASKKSKKCVIIGPKVKDNNRDKNLLPKSIRYEPDIENTKFILVSDFNLMKKQMPKIEYDSIVSELYEKLGGFYVIADINQRVDDISSLEEFLS